MLTVERFCFQYTSMYVVRSILCRLEFFNIANLCEKEYFMLVMFCTAVTFEHLFIMHN